MQIITRIDILEPFIFLLMSILKIAFTQKFLNVLFFAKKVH